uniref:Uncharacterized protein n=1 Tax=Faxonius propinquus nudivirus TaxID=3139431 RepID=A0AAU8GBN5_9VIRU
MVATKEFFTNNKYFFKEQNKYIHNYIKVFLIDSNEAITSNINFICPDLFINKIELIEKSITWYIYINNKTKVMKGLRVGKYYEYCGENSCIIECQNDLKKHSFYFIIEKIKLDTIKIPSDNDFLESSYDYGNILEIHTMKRIYYFNNIEVITIYETLKPFWKFREIHNTYGLFNYKSNLTILSHFIPGMALTSLSEVKDKENEIIEHLFLVQNKLEIRYINGIDTMKESKYIPYDIFDFIDLVINIQTSYFHIPRLESNYYIKSPYMKKIKTFLQNTLTFDTNNLMKIMIIKENITKYELKINLINDLNLNSNEFQYINDIIIKKAKITNNKFNGLFVENAFDLTPSGSIIYSPKYFRNPTFLWKDFINKEEKNIDNIIQAFYTTMKGNRNRLLSYANNINNDIFRKSISIDPEYIKKIFVLYSSAKYKNNFHPTLGTPGLEFTSGWALPLDWTIPFSINTPHPTGRDWDMSNVLIYSYLSSFEKIYVAKTRNGEMWKCSMRDIYTSNVCKPTSNFQNLIESKLKPKLLSDFSNNMSINANRTMSFISGLYNTKKFTDLGTLEKFEVEIYRRIFEYKDLMNNLNPIIINKMSIYYIEKVFSNLQNFHLLGNEHKLAVDFITQMNSVLKYDKINSLDYDHFFDEQIPYFCMQNEFKFDFLKQKLPALSEKFTKNQIIANQNEWWNISHPIINEQYLNLRKTLNYFTYKNLTELSNIYNKYLLGNLEFKLIDLLTYVRGFKVKAFKAQQGVVNFLWIFKYLLYPFKLFHNKFNELEKDWDSMMTIDDENAEQFRERKNLVLLENLFKGYDKDIQNLTNKKKRIISLAIVIQLCSILENCDFDSTIKSLLIIMDYDRKILGPKGHKIARNGLPYTTLIEERNYEVIPHAMTLVNRLDTKKFLKLVDNMNEKEKTKLYNFNPIEALTLLVPNGFDINTKQNTEKKIPRNILKTPNYAYIIEDLFNFIIKTNPDYFLKPQPKAYKEYIYKYVKNIYKFNNFYENLDFWGVEINDIDMIQVDKIIEINIEKKISKLSIYSQEHKIKQIINKCTKTNNNTIQNILAKGFEKSIDLNVCIYRKDEKLSNLIIIFNFKLKAILFLDKQGHNIFYPIEFLFHSIYDLHTFQNNVAKSNSINIDSITHIKKTFDSMNTRMLQLYSILHLLPHSIKIQNYKNTFISDDDMISMNKFYRNDKESIIPKLLTFEQFRMVEYKYRKYILKENKITYDVKKHLHNILQFGVYIHLEKKILKSDNLPHRKKKKHYALKYETMIKKLFTLEYSTIINIFDEHFLLEKIEPKCRTINLLNKFYYNRMDKIQSFDFNFNNLYKYIIDIIQCNMETRWCNLVLAKLFKENYYKLAVHNQNNCANAFNNVNITRIMNSWFLLNSTYIPIAGYWKQANDFILKNDYFPPNFQHTLKKFWKNTKDNLMNKAHQLPENEYKSLTQNNLLIVDKNSVSIHFMMDYICTYFPTLLYTENENSNSLFNDKTCILGKARLLKWQNKIDLLFGINFINQIHFDTFFQNVKMFSIPSSYYYIPELLGNFQGNIQKLFNSRKIDYLLTDEDYIYLSDCFFCKFNNTESDFHKPNINTIINKYSQNLFMKNNINYNILEINNYSNLQLYKLMKFFQKVIDSVYGHSVNNNDLNNIKHSQKQNIKLKYNTKKNKNEPDEFITFDIYKQLIANIKLNDSFYFNNEDFEKDLRSYITYKLPNSYDLNKFKKITFVNTHSETLLLYLFSLAFAYENYPYENYTFSNFQQFEDFKYNPKQFKKFRTRELEYLADGISGFKRTNIQNDMCNRLITTQDLDLDYIKNSQEFKELDNFQITKIMIQINTANYIKHTILLPYHFLSGIDTQYAKMMRNDFRSFKEGNISDYNYLENIKNLMDIYSRDKFSPHYSFTLDAPPYLFFTKGFTTSSYNASDVYGVQEIVHGWELYANIVIDIVISIVFAQVGGAGISKIASASKNMFQSTFRMLSTIINSIKKDIIKFRLDDIFKKTLNKLQNNAKLISTRFDKYITYPITKESQKLKHSFLNKQKGLFNMKPITNKKSPQLQRQNAIWYEKHSGLQRGYRKSNAVQTLENQNIMRPNSIYQSADDVVSTQNDLYVSANDFFVSTQNDLYVPFDSTIYGSLGNRASLQGGIINKMPMNKGSDIISDTYTLSNKIQSGLGVTKLENSLVDDIALEITNTKLSYKTKNLPILDGTYKRTFNDKITRFELLDAKAPPLPTRNPPKLPSNVLSKQSFYLPALSENSDEILAQTLDVKNGIKIKTPLKNSIDIQNRPRYPLPDEIEANKFFKHNPELLKYLDNPRMGIYEDVFDDISSHIYEEITDLKPSVFKYGYDQLAYTDYSIRPSYKQTMTSKYILGSTLMSSYINSRYLYETLYSNSNYSTYSHYNNITNHRFNNYPTIFKDFENFIKKKDFNGSITILHMLTDMFSNSGNYDGYGDYSLKSTNIGESIKLYEYCSNYVSVNEKPIFKQNVGYISPDVFDVTELIVDILANIINSPKICKPLMINILPEYFNPSTFQELDTCKKKTFSTGYDVYENDNVWLNTLDAAIDNKTKQYIFDNGIIIPKYHDISLIGIGTLLNNSISYHKWFDDFIYFNQHTPNYGQEGFILMNIALVFTDHLEFTYISPIRTSQFKDLQSSKIFLDTILSTLTPAEGIFFQDDLSMNENGDCYMCLLVNTSDGIGTFVNFKFVDHKRFLNQTQKRYVRDISDIYDVDINNNLALLNILWEKPVIVELISNNETFIKKIIITNSNKNLIHHIFLFIVCMLIVCILCGSWYSYIKKNYKIYSYKDDIDKAQMSELKILKISKPIMYLPANKVDDINYEEICTL